MAYARTEAGGKKLRYCGVSTVFVPFGQVLIQVFGLWLGNYTVASLVAAAIVTIPNFFANKHYVWRLASRDNMHRQVLAFWVAMMLGASLATLFTHLVEIVTVGQTQPIRSVSVLAAQLLGYGIVWLGRFFLLDRWLFNVPEDLPQTSSGAHPPGGNSGSTLGHENGAGVSPREFMARAESNAAATSE
jgi:putative flippase GtrA